MSSKKETPYILSQYRHSVECEICKGLMFARNDVRSILKYRYCYQTRDPRILVCGVCNSNLKTYGLLYNQRIEVNLRDPYLVKYYAKKCIMDDNIFKIWISSSQYFYIHFDENNNQMKIICIDSRENKFFTKSIVERDFYQLQIDINGIFWFEPYSKNGMNRTEIIYTYLIHQPLFFSILCANRVFPNLAGNIDIWYYINQFM